MRKILVFIISILLVFFTIVGFKISKNVNKTCLLLLF